ncbi:MAG: hypothetical protein JXB43_03060, partial [Dehalococcoidia bacterium]|nr:hypothetical protein [Dehalococcoidia bacterium]
QKASEEDTLYSDVFDGMDGRVLKNKAAIEMMKGGFPLFSAIKSAWEIKKQLKLSMARFIGLSFSMMKSDEEGESKNLFAQARQATGAILAEKAIYDGDMERGMLYAGQCIGGINDLPSVKELIERIIAEAEETIEATRKKVH